MQLISISVVTDKKTEFGQNPKIGPCVQAYFEKVGDQVPPKTLCAYTNYVSNHEGHYTFFIGSDRFESIPEGLETLMIPEQTYETFPIKAGEMPAVII
ncbi:MAG: hypothetical protein S4CHLAM81_12610 [Chlamydiales bacterium]|nr:hypothetical protein [Chlamydiales bacterium]MCH9636036.1 hypothetical protein [Chlamydiales bacterium]MCH9703607.1 hypothetical protein [Chlamydiota bacterium]